MSKKGTGALLVGLAAGAITGVLFSPNKGKEFRKKVKAEIKSGSYGQKTLWNHFKGMAHDIKETYDDSALDQAIEKGIDKVKKEAKEAKQAVSKKAKSVAKKTTAKAKTKAKSTAKKAATKAKTTAKKAASKAKKKA